jgi:hypothetical protein
MKKARRFLKTGLSVFVSMVILAVLIVSPGEAVPQMVSEPYQPITTPQWDPWFGCWYIDSGLYGEVQAMAVYNNELYIGGSFDETWMGTVTDLNGIARWDGHFWVPVGNGPGPYAVVNALAVYNNELYAGGESFNVGGTKGIARWNGSSWNAVGTGVGNGYETVHALLAAGDGKLYVGGDFITAGGQTVNNIATWNGSSWSAVNSVIHPTSGIGVDDSVFALAEYMGFVFAGGRFYYPNPPPPPPNPNGCIAMINGNGTLVQVLGGLSGWNAYYQMVQAMAVYNGVLYMGGRFTQAQPGNILVGHIAGYNMNTGTWSTVGGGIYHPAGMPVLALTTFNDGTGMALYMGGMFDTLGPTGSVFSNCLAKWNGSVWSTVGAGGIGCPQDYPIVWELFPYNGDLYIGGGFDNIPLDLVYGYEVELFNIARYATKNYFVSDKYEIREGGTDTLTFSLDAGISNAGRSYMVLGSLNCTYPGSTFPSGLILPFIWDGFTDFVVQNVNTPMFTNFQGTLDSFGQAQAALNYVGMPYGYAGTTLYFTFVLYDGIVDYASSPLPVDIVQ